MPFMSGIGSDHSRLQQQSSFNRLEFRNSRDFALTPMVMMDFGAAEKLWALSAA
jgi:hypothetical protein